MNKSELDFKNKTAVVTGSTRGIGKSIADLLGEHGCHVVRTGTKSDSVLDLTDDASVKAFLAGLEKLEAVDILVNNAGINFVEPIDGISEDQWQRIMKVNLTGAMLLMKAVSKKMIVAARGGKILNMSSIFGLISRAGRDSYSSSKAGLIGLTRAAAIDLAPHNILVNALCPGFTFTDLTRSMLSGEEMKALADEIPIKRMAEEAEIAKAAIFLCSDLNTYMTGQVLVVDGGYVIA
ncbi:MAG: SDR family NAD(P)-dependent oxidoreductase [Candidatus Margulisiibacteriota bacterium]